MKIIWYHNFKKLLILTLVGVCLSGCKTEVKNQNVVYSNDFEGNDITNINNGLTTVYNNSTVLGRYNNGGFSLAVNNLPNHSLIAITFDLNIHDNWRGQLAPDGADIWQMLVDNMTYINTTFSNLNCAPGNICPPQSYPYDHPNNYNNPRKGAFRTDLPGVCSLQGVVGGTTQYKITKTIKHSERSLLLKCLDKLNQTNHADPKCDKSWSVDNITIKAITL